MTEADKPASSIQEISASPFSLSFQGHRALCQGSLWPRMNVMHFRLNPFCSPCPAQGPAPAAALQPQCRSTLSILLLLLPSSHGSPSQQQKGFCPSKHQPSSFPSHAVCLGLSSNTHLPPLPPPPQDCISGAVTIVNELEQRWCSGKVIPRDV